jgi:integrase
MQPLLAFKPLAQCPLDRITPATVDEFVNWRRKQRGRRGTVTAATINHSLRTLHRMLALASEWNVITKPPKITLLGNENQRDYVLRDETIAQFDRERGLIGRIVPFLTDTGLRRAEICALTWDYVSLSDRWIKVRRGKSKAARRTIPLTNRAAEILAALPTDCPNVFSIRGRAITPVWLSHAFKRVARKLGLPEEAVLHSTRHTFCTRLGESGADAFAIQRLAGHSSITISQRYVHPSGGLLDQTIARLNH